MKNKEPTEAERVFIRNIPDFNMRQSAWYSLRGGEFVAEFKAVNATFNEGFKQGFIYAVILMAIALGAIAFVTGV